MATGFPKVPAAAWRTLRTRAAAAPSSKFTPQSVAAMLNMANPKSAGDNIVYPMRRLGLMDDEGVLTERGHKWRVDASYPAACQEILDEIYSSELATLTDAGGGPDRVQVETWFRHKGFGDSNARQMAATYSMIAEKKIPDGGPAEVKKKTPTGSKTPKGARGKPAPQRSEVSPEPEAEPIGAQVAADDAPALRRSSGTLAPNIHLDIQIHIPADASLEQIEQIFASMAKHLYQW